MTVFTAFLTNKLSPGEHQTSKPLQNFANPKLYCRTYLRCLRLTIQAFQPADFLSALEHFAAASTPRLQIIFLLKLSVISH